MATMNDLSSIFKFQELLYMIAQKWHKFGENQLNRF